MLVFTLILFLLIFNLPSDLITPSSDQFIIAFGMLAIWRYSWGLINYVRSIIYRKFVFPSWRAEVSADTDALMPSKIYLLLTSFRIDAETTARTVHAATKEAIACGVPVTLVASIVELADEFLYKDVFQSLNPPPGCY